MALNIPSEMRAGDSISFIDSLSNYPAPTWTLTYTLINSENKITFSSTADGDDHSFSLAPAKTALWAANSYRVQATVTDGTDRFTVGSGNISILPDFTASSTEQITHVERCLNALEAVLEGKATQDQLSMQFNGRSITRFSPSDLLMWRDKYRAELSRAKRAERIKLGFKGAGTVRARF